MQKIKDKFNGARLRWPDRNHVLHHTFHGMHGVYFGSVFLQGHGVYAIAGGIMVVLIGLNYVLHFD